MPYLSRISVPVLDASSYLAHIPSLRNGVNLSLRRNVTFFVGENGSGKSTLLEGIAEQCGFSLRGGSRILRAYGGRSLHEQSHGESFLALFNNQFESGIYLLDEPEAALSPARMLAFISVIHRLATNGRAQFIIATHSPILICYAGAVIYQFDTDGIKETTYEDTEHYQLTKSFLDNPDAYLRHLMEG